MKRCKYLILGAGPSGLSLAYKLIEKGINDIIVLEKESEAGGLCRSKMVDGSYFDIGGGHFLDVRRQEVVDFLFDFMPREEWDEYDRDSQIQLKDKRISHPIEANIWQMDEAMQKEYLDSFKKPDV